MNESIVLTYYCCVKREWPALMETLFSYFRKEDTFWLAPYELGKAGNRE